MTGWRRCSWWSRDPLATPNLRTTHEARSFGLGWVGKPADLRGGADPRSLLLGPWTPKQRLDLSWESRGLRRAVSGSAGEHLELPRAWQERSLVCQLPRACAGQSHSHQGAGSRRSTP